MPSPFDALDAAIQAEVDATFAEGITIRPWAGDANYGGAADPTRPVTENVRAIVARAPAVAATDFINSNRKGAPLSVAPASAWLARDAVAGLPFALRRGDHIEFPAANEAAIIAAVQKGDHGDLNLVFVASGAAQ